MERRNDAHLSDSLEHRTIVGEVSIIDNAVDVPFRLPPEGRKRFDFTGEEESASRHRVVQRVDPQAIASSEKKPAIGIIEHKSEFSEGKTVR